MLAQASGGNLEQQAMNALPWIGVIFGLAIIVLFVAIFVARQFRRCPSNQVLVVYGRVGGGKAARCLHGGGTLVVPLVQDYAYLSLEPMVIDIPLEGALSLTNIRVNVPSTFTVGIATDPVLMNNAAERLLNLSVSQIREQAQDIILGQLRLVIATLTIEEINKDREKFMTLINENVGQEINKIGLDLINVNVRDITDESGYIEAIGKRAAAEAINRAKVEVAQQERDGAVGQATATREQEVSVSLQRASAEQLQRFEEEFKRSLMQFYGNALLEYDNQDIRVLPVANAQDAQRSTVNMEIRDARGTVYPLSYTMVRLDEQWKLRNMVINGINVGKLFRDQFAQSMQSNRNDLDKTIAGWAELVARSRQGEQAAAQ